MEELREAVFYKIYCKDASIKDCYIGSTFNFTGRKNKHKHDCNTEKRIIYNSKVYKFIREHGGWEHWNMDEFERIKVKDSKEKRILEREFMELENSSLNTLRAYVSEEERIEIDKNYKIENKEIQSLRRKKYYRDNTEKCKERKKQKINCECGCVVVIGTIARHRKLKKHKMLIQKNT